MVFDINNVGVVQSVTMCSLYHIAASNLQLGLTQCMRECTELMDNASICYIIIENTYSMTNLVLSYHCKLRLVWVIV